VVSTSSSAPFPPLPELEKLEIDEVEIRILIDFFLHLKRWNDALEEPTP
jgi:hypothetical protein